MDAKEAREHLEMVDRILSEAEVPRWRPYSRLLIAMGVSAAIIEAGMQIGADGHGYAVDQAGSVLMVLSYAYLIWIGVSARRKAERMAASEARFGKACWAVWMAVFIAAFAQPLIFSNWAAGAIWNLGGAIQMLMIGGFGNRWAVVGGLILAASIPVANYIPAAPGFVLAGGFVLGYVVPAIVNLLDGEDHDIRG